MKEPEQTNTVHGKIINDYLDVKKKETEKADLKPFRCPNPKCQSWGSMRKTKRKQTYKCEACGTLVVIKTVGEADHAW